MTALFSNTRRDNDVPTLPPRTVGDAIADLRHARAEWRSRQDEARDVESFPSRNALERIVSLLAAALYPRRLGHFRGVAAEEDIFVVARLLAALTDLDHERDEVALALAGRMIEAGKPVFGICRSLQEINVLFGGTLSTEFMPRSASSRIVGWEFRHAVRPPPRCRAQRWRPARLRDRTSADVGQLGP